MSLGLASSGLATAASAPVTCRRIIASPSAKSKRLLAALRYPQLLGRPASWQAVKDGLFPIPPERVVILNRAGWEETSIHRNASPVPRRSCQSEGVPRTARIAETLATYYSVPEEEEELAELMAAGDDNEGPVCCESVALLRFCKQRSLAFRDNPLIHWWLFVSPGDADTWPFEKELLDPPTHVTIVYAASDTKPEQAGLLGLYLAHLIYRVHARPAKWRQVASMTHVHATEFINREMIVALRDVPTQ